MHMWRWRVTSDSISFSYAHETSGVDHRCCHLCQMRARKVRVLKRNTNVISHCREIFRFNAFELLTRFSSSFLVLFLPNEEKHRILTNPWNTQRSFERFSNNIFLSGEWTPIIMHFSLFSRPVCSSAICSTSVDLIYLSLPRFLTRNWFSLNNLALSAPEYIEIFLPSLVKINYAFMSVKRTCFCIPGRFSWIPILL